MIQVQKDFGYLTYVGGHRCVIYDLAQFGLVILSNFMIHVQDGGRQDSLLCRGAVVADDLLQTLSICIAWGMIQMHQNASHCVHWGFCHDRMIK